MRKYDVVIIGAGPAGSYLAYKLKSQGISILILEKEVFPRYKTCAGGLSKKAYDILFSDNKNIENIIQKQIKNVLYIQNKNFTFRESEKELIYTTYRYELDRFLVDMAVDNDTVWLKENVSVQKINQKDNSVTYLEEDKEQNVSYNIVVGAWGNNRRLNNLVDLTPFHRYAISSSWEGPVGPKFSKYFDGYATCQILPKYPGIVGYIFPKSELITAGLFTSLYPIPPNLKNMWKEFIDFWRLDSTIKPRYAMIPIRDFRKSIAKKNILLVGDAAGLADPFTGEGIYYAFVSSMIAAKNILCFFKNENYDLAHSYMEDINSKMFDIQKWALVYEFLFHHFPNVSFWFGSDCFLGNEILNAFVRGEIKYNEVSKIIQFSGKRMLERIEAYFK